MGKGKRREERKERKEGYVFVGGHWMSGCDFALQLCPHDRTMQTTSLVTLDSGSENRGASHNSIEVSIEEFMPVGLRGISWLPCRSSESPEVQEGHGMRDIKRLIDRVLS